jgi:hypothetical protein
VFLPGGPDRPLLYAGSDLSLNDMFSGAGNLTVNGPVYSYGEIDVGTVSVGSHLLAAESGFVAVPEASSLAVPSGVEAGESPFDLRLVHPATIPSAVLRSSLVELGGTACLSSAGTNVASSTVQTYLCLSAGSSFTTVDGVEQVLPSDELAYSAFLAIPLAEGEVRLYARSSTPTSWPGDLTEWTLLGDARLPSSGLVFSDATFVLGHCGSAAATCLDWDGDGVPGSRIDHGFTVVVGSLDVPADLYVASAILSGSNSVGAVVSGRAYVAAAATAESVLDLDIALAVLGRPGQPLLSAYGTPAFSLDLSGALLLSRAQVDLSGFVAASLSVDSALTPSPFFPAPSMRYGLLYRQALSGDDLQAALG